MNSISLVIERPNLSHAWAEAFLALMNRGVNELVPLVVSVTEFANGRPEEDVRVRNLLNDTLARLRMDPCETAAATIFPDSMWNPRRDSSELFAEYVDNLPMLREADPRNSLGTYFERMIAFGPHQFNQLDHIVQTYRRGNRRRTALQVAIFSPEQDHTHQLRRPFPCLGQVAFTPTEHGTLHVTGFYAAQNLLDKAYGNYLGLCGLGRFVAHELDLQLTGMTCIAAVGLGPKSKSTCRDLERHLKQILPSNHL